MAGGDILWVSDDGPIAGLAANRDRIFCVTSSQLVSFARDGSDVRVLAKGSQYDYSGAIAANDATVYWGKIDSASSTQPSGIWSVPHGGGPETALGTEGYITFAITLDSTAVYWMTDDAVLSTPLGGGPTTQLAVPQGITYEDAFVVSGGQLYWSTNSSAGGPAGNLFRMPLGGMPLAIAPGPVFSLRATATGIAWLESPSPAIVSLTAATQAINRDPLTGWVDAFATDGSNWYWRDSTSGVVYAQDIAGGPPRALTEPVQLATSNFGDGPEIIVDSHQLIWADRRGAAAYQPDYDVVRAIAIP
jgi:hypothetical protein